MFVFLFAASITAGMSLHELIGSQQRDYYQEKYVFRKLLWWIPIFILILAILFSMAGQEMLRLYAKIFYPQLLTDSQWAVTRMKNAIEDIPDIVKGFWYASMSLIVVATLITLFLRGILGRRWLLIIPLLIVCNGVRFNQRFISTIDQNKRFGPNPVADYLSTHSSYYRALGFACNDNDFNLGINHIQGTLGNHGNEPYWYYEFLHHDGLLRTFFNRRFVNLLGVKYLIYPKSGILPVDTLGPIPLDTAGIFGVYVIFINHNCFPRAFFVNDFEVIPERKQIYSAILGGKSDVRNRVILEEEPDLELAVGDTSKSSAEISQYDPNYIRISIHTSANKLLVLSDNYYPAWHAYVDGIERRILRAFGSFRAIEVPAGSGEVILKYESPIYDRGVLITLISVTWLAGVLSYYALKKYVLLRRGY